MSVERVERKDGTVVWRVRWRHGGRNRSKVLWRKRDVALFVEYDRTRRVDKNYDRFRRYEHSSLAGGATFCPKARAVQRSCSSARTRTSASASSTPPIGSSLSTNRAGRT